MTIYRLLQVANNVIYNLANLSNTKPDVIQFLNK